MRERGDISREDFVAAVCTVATVVADGVWQNLQMSRQAVKRRVLPGTLAAMNVEAAAKYCGFGRTRFRELVTDGVFPQPVMIEGRKRWLAKDLDVALARFGKTERRGE